MTDGHRRSRRPRLSLAYRLRGSPPADLAAPPLLILLHGIGGNELAMAALAPAFDVRFLVISARSPVEIAPFSFAWLSVELTPDGPRVDAAEARRAWEALLAFIDEAVAAFGADPHRVFVAGFSQGGIVALAALLTAPEKIAGVVCMSGRLLPEALPAAAPPDRLRGKPALIIHGVHDATLPVDYGRRAAATLRELHLATDYRELDLGHATSDESIAIASSWLTERLGS
jgi:phospholipase/carboxylesterase